MRRISFRAEQVLDPQPVLARAGPEAPRESRDLVKHVPHVRPGEAVLLQRREQLLGPRLLLAVVLCVEEQQEKTPVAALTELFLELKTDQTPAVVERIVGDIDSIVRVVRFPGWQDTSGGEREVQKALRKALLKYKLHKDQVLFERAYGYVKEYY